MPARLRLQKYIVSLCNTHYILAKSYFFFGVLFLLTLGEDLDPASAADPIELARWCVNDGAFISSLRGTLGLVAMEPGFDDDFSSLRSITKTSMLVTLLVNILLFFHGHRYYGNKGNVHFLNW